MDKIERLNEYIQSDPTDSFLLHALALEKIKNGDDATARNLFEELLTREPEYVGSYYHLGKLLERNGETMLAIEWYKKGMEAARIAGDNQLQAAYDDLAD
jgi:Tfp pilus assembly protein PilF